MAKKYGLIISFIMGGVFLLLHSYSMYNTVLKQPCGYELKVGFPLTKVHAVYEDHVNVESNVADTGSSV